MPWDPDQYLAFTDERALPFHHLVVGVRHLQPRRVLDAGCGPGAMTATLLERWPDAKITGIDSSPEMIELAQRRAHPDRLGFELGDIMNWAAEEPHDLILSNACFHWIENHGVLLDRLASLAAANATLAFQIPANHDQPSHTILDALCSDESWSDSLGSVRQVNVESPEWYADELDVRGFRATVWQTTYLHRLEGEDPVLEWVKGTTLTPVLERLSEPQIGKFLREYRARLREAYPARGGTTVFPFTRTFVVASR